MKLIFWHLLFKKVQLMNFEYLQFIVIILERVVQCAVTNQNCGDFLKAIKNTVVQIKQKIWPTICYISHSIDQIRVNSTLWIPIFQFQKGLVNEIDESIFLPSNSANFHELSFLAWMYDSWKVLSWTASDKSFPTETAVFMSLHYFWDGEGDCDSIGIHSEWLDFNRIVLKVSPELNFDFHQLNMEHA